MRCEYCKTKSEARDSRGNCIACGAELPEKNEWEVLWKIMEFELEVQARSLEMSKIPKPLPLMDAFGGGASSGKEYRPPQLLNWNI